MRKGRFWLCLGVVLAGAAALAALLEPTRVVRGYLAGEVFHRGRPTSYWREVLREHGRQGGIPPETARQFRDGYAAFPVLSACARDPDPHVRWPAIGLIGQSGARTEQALAALVEALGDESVEVRLKALEALGGWGRMARPAVPVIAGRLTDPEPQVAFVADLALWEVDEPAAVRGSGWRRFTSPEYRFSVMLPDEPERDSKPAVGGGPVVVHAFATWHRTGSESSPTRYTVAVSEYPAEVIEGASEDERLDASRDWGLFGLGGKLVGERAVTQHGLKGREQVVEVEGKGVVRTRLFWAGRKLYQANVVSKPRFLNAKAADYFLDSFRLTGDASP
jgi:hypothetical protein